MVQELGLNWSFSSPFEVTTAKCGNFCWDGNLIFGALMYIDCNQEYWKFTKSNLEIYQYTADSHPIYTATFGAFVAFYAQTKVYTSWTSEKAAIMLVRDVLRSMGCCAWLCAVLPSDRFGSKVRLQLGGALDRYVTASQGTLLQLYSIVIFCSMMSLADTLSWKNEMIHQLKLPWPWRELVNLSCLFDLASGGAP